MQIGNIVAIDPLEFEHLHACTNWVIITFCVCASKRTNERTNKKTAGVIVPNLGAREQENKKNGRIN